MHSFVLELAENLSIDPEPLARDSYAKPNATAATPMSQSLYEIVTGKIMYALEQGVIPWRKPWDSSASLPINAISQKPYRGVNTFLLGLSDFRDHRWLTFRQVQELGGTVQKGQHSSLVVFWKFQEPKEEDEQTKRRPPILRYFNVFNAEQCEGLGLPELPKRQEVPPNELTVKSELLIDGMPDKPVIAQKGTSAWYSPSQDLVQIPSPERFESIDHYYATLFHELAHASGHERRLNRKGITEVNRFGSEAYSQEELVAELTSAYCCATVGLDNSLIENSASYIASWLEALQAEPKLLVFAASQAQKAADYIRGVTYS